MPAEESFPLSDPPVIPGYLWRPLHPVDMQALRQMLTDCSVVDGHPSAPQERLVENIETDTLAAVGNAGQIAAYVWLSLHKTPDLCAVNIDWQVHPDYRRFGLGAFLLHWADARAEAMLASFPDTQSYVISVAVGFDLDILAPGLLIMGYQQLDENIPQHFQKNFASDSQS